MLKQLKKIVTYINIRFLSFMASFALLITTLAVNQRCWYVMYEDKLPQEYNKLNKRKSNDEISKTSNH
ncbi:MAG: cyclic lactone autoinducer peptide [Blautia sp.]